jgi:hemolysin activation/secretion protein
MIVMSYFPSSRWRTLCWCVLQVSPVVWMGGVSPALASAQLPNNLPASEPDVPSQNQPIARSSRLTLLSAPSPTAPELLPGEHYELSGKPITQILHPLKLTQAITIPSSAQPPIDRRLPTTPAPSPNPISPPQPLQSAPNTQTEETSQRLCSTSNSDASQTSPGTIIVDQFKFYKDSKDKLLSSEELKSWGFNEIVKPCLGQKLQMDTLVDIASRIAKEFAKKGYRTSGAVVVIPDETQENKRGRVYIRIIEGKLTEINVNLVTAENEKGEITPINRPPLAGYVRSRLKLAQQQPLNIDKLQEALQLLQFDSDAILESVRGRLSAGVNPGESILDVSVTPKKRTLGFALTTDNNRVPSVGSMQRRVTIKEANLLGFGDSLSIGYNNSNGSNTWDMGYVLPLTPRNTTLSFNYSRSNSAVIEAPFDDLDGDGKTGDIRSSSQSYEISLRHPLFRQIARPRPVDEELKGEAKKADEERAKKEEERGSVFREFAVGLTGSLRDSRTSLLDIPFPLSPGADDNGFSRIFALRIFQEFTQQDAREVLFLRSQFNLGLNALGSTINIPIAGLNDVVPDSRFLSWQGQALWTRRLGTDRQKAPLLTVRANMQLADRALVSSEQLSIGGFGTVRGYRQDVVQSDNGMVATIELQQPFASIGKSNQGIFSVIPFVDYGMGWNSAGKAPSPNALLSTGLGLKFQYEQFTARLDWGIPLISVPSKGSTWQDKGIHFSLQWNGF